MSLQHVRCRRSAVGLTESVSIQTASALHHIHLAPSMRGSDDPHDAEVRSQVTPHIEAHERRNVVSESHITPALLQRVSDRS